MVAGVPISLDEFRGTPYIQVDLRVARPVKFREGWTVMPFIEFFNLFNRNNPGANFVTNVAALPLPANQFVPGGVIGITSLKQLEVPAGGLGDFFGPGTTVGIPFRSAAWRQGQLLARLVDVFEVLPLS